MPKHKDLLKEKKDLIKEVVSNSDLKKSEKGLESLETQKQTKVIDIGKFIQEQHAQYEEGLTASELWKQNQLKWYKKRYGLRKTVTFPWRGASNLHLPLQDKTIRKFKPEYVSILWNTSPVCNLESLESESLEAAEEASWHFDWLFRTRMNAYEDVLLITDKHLQKGFEIVKTVYERKKEPRLIRLMLSELKEMISKNLINQQDADVLENPGKVEVIFQVLSNNFGFDREDAVDAAKMLSIAVSIWSKKEAVEFNIDQVVYDAPKLEVIDPEYITVPADTKAVFTLEKARWIDHKFYVTPEEMIQNSLSGKWDKDTVNEILSQIGYKNMGEDRNIDGTIIPDNYIERQTKSREGLQIMGTKHHIIIHQVCLWYDSDSDNAEERHILEYAEIYQKKELRFIRYPYNMAMWPYVRVPFEVLDDGFYSSRGTVEIEDPIATALNVQHNQKINRQTLATTPTLIYAPGNFNPSNMKFIPGQAVPVASPVSQNAHYLTHPNVDGSFMNEEAILKGWDEEYIASQDFGITSPSSISGAQRARSATEISQVSQNRLSVRSLDIQIWKAAWQEIFKRLWFLWMQYGPEKVFAYVNSEGKSVEIYKDNYKGNWKFSPNGKFGVSDPLIEAQKAARRFEVLKGDPMINQYELYREMLMLDDPRRQKRLLKTKEQLAQEQQAAQQAEMAKLQMSMQGAKMPQEKGTPSAARPQQITGGQRAEQAMGGMGG
ncbi:MAG TPA: hypothetical protein VJ000_01255 [Thermodesulfovibrionia bacterium]|nr:hypothetical protein [Thermodesulfovibrionia bacterium]